MKVYPKVPRFDHDVVDPQVYSADDLTLLEKTDGQNFRTFLYDSRYHEDYTEDVYEHDPSDGDVFFGTKNVIQGTLSTDPSELKGNFKRVLSYLQDNLDVDALYNLHDEYNSPLVLFGEHMIRHTLNYNYRQDPPPAVLGFDVFKQTEYTLERPSNPYDETFEGFLPFSEAQSIFDTVGLPTISIVDDAPETPLDPETVTIPTSRYASIKAEGVVFRSDKLNIRTKKVTDDFKENMKKAWGLREDQAESGEELVSAWYVTNARIRKYIHKHIQKNENIDVAELAEEIVKDIWIEEWEEIAQIGIPLNPRNVYDLTVERCEEILEKMETNATLNDADLGELWDANTDVEPSDTGTFDLDTDQLDAVEDTVAEYDSVEMGLIDTLLPHGTILEMALQTAEEEEKEFDRWVIPIVRDELRDFFWTEYLSILANLSVQYTPTDLNEELLNLIVDTVNDHLDASETTSAEQSDQSEAIGEFFK